jgi:DNA-binding protein HU-beta
MGIKITIFKKTIFMDKKTPAAPSAEQPSLFDKAGEVLSGIGHKISDAKDSVTSFVKDEAVVVKKATKKIARIIKKAVKKAPVKKALAKKAAAKKVVPKKKVVKKAAPKKAAKKAVKKVASNKKKK